jgi:hypothetical protein
MSTDDTDQENYWKCSRCTALNEDVPNVYHCSVCDAFQSRIPSLPQEYQMGNWSLVQVFPERATHAMIKDYYEFNVKRYAPVEIMDLCREIAEFLSFCYEEGDLVDVFYQRIWYQAKIVQIGKDEIKITYVGWGDQWNEWLPMYTPRIEPYRCRSVGDTSAVNMKHLFRPREFCPDANLIYEFQQLGYSVQNIVNALERTRNHRADSLHLLTAQSQSATAPPRRHQNQNVNFLFNSNTLRPRYFPPGMQLPRFQFSWNVA